MGENREKIKTNPIAIGIFLVFLLTKKKYSATSYMCYMP